jgi:ABC-type glycerol-3-phosphate transport system substrate-binding protein
MQRKNRVRASIALFISGSLVLAGCATSNEEAQPSDSVAPTNTLSDEGVCEAITVLTNRTDIVDTVFTQEYAPAFAALNGGTQVKFEAITDYPGEVSIRLNTDDYGDVLLIPDTVKQDQLPDFFEPLGTIEGLSSQFRFLDEKAYEGNVYGIAVVGNAQGYVVNKRIWAEAGITEPPETPEAWIADLQTIADNTDAIPLYTNYKDGWPMNQWNGARLLVDGPEAVNLLISDKTPWADGRSYNITDGMLYDAVSLGLTEADPATTAWEPSKTMLGSGEIATMVLGSWAITQMQDAAIAAGFPVEDIDYWPWPIQKDGKFQAVVTGDYKMGVNVNSECKATARAFVNWFILESGFAFDQGGISPIQNGPTPGNYQTFADLGVQFVEQAAPIVGEEGTLGEIEAEAEIGFFVPAYRQGLIDSARAGVSKAEAFSDLNAQWTSAVEAVTGK